MLAQLHAVPTNAGAGGPLEELIRLLLAIVLFETLIIAGLIVSLRAVRRR
jgi:hypothetical protein